MIISAIGLLLWYFTRHAYYALFITIFVDAIGFILIFIKTREDPTSETLSSYVLFSSSGILGALSVGKYNGILLSYPLYIFLFNLIEVVLILFGRSRKAK